MHYGDRDGEGDGDAEDSLSYDEAGEEASNLKTSLKKGPYHGFFFKPKGKVAEGGGVLLLGW